MTENIKYLLKLAEAFRCIDGRGWDPLYHPKGTNGQFVKSGIKKANKKRKSAKPKKYIDGLSPSEYVRVTHELNTHMSKEDRNRKIVRKCVGNYMYTFINNGFDNYIFLDKIHID